MLQRARTITETHYLEPEEPDLDLVNMVWIRPSYVGETARISYEDTECEGQAHSLKLRMWNVSGDPRSRNIIAQEADIAVFIVDDSLPIQEQQAFLVTGYKELQKRNRWAIRILAVTTKDWEQKKEQITALEKQMVGVQSIVYDAGQSKSSIVHAFFLEKIEIALKLKKIRGMPGSDDEAKTIAIDAQELAKLVENGDLTEEYINQLQESSAMENELNKLGNRINTLEDESLLESKPEDLESEQNYNWLEKIAALNPDDDAYEQGFIYAKIDSEGEQSDSEDEQQGDDINESPELENIEKHEEKSEEKMEAVVLVQEEEKENVSQGAPLADDDRHMVVTQEELARTDELTPGSSEFSAGSDKVLPLATVSELEEIEEHEEKSAEEPVGQEEEKSAQDALLAANDPRTVVTQNSGQSEDHLYSFRTWKDLQEQSTFIMAEHKKVTAGNAQANHHYLILIAQGYKRKITSEQIASLKRDLGAHVIDIDPEAVRYQEARFDRYVKQRFQEHQAEQEEERAAFAAFEREKERVGKKSEEEIGPRQKRIQRFHAALEQFDTEIHREKRRTDQDGRRLLSSQDAITILNAATALAKEAADGALKEDHIKVFKQKTKKFMKSPHWALILGAIVGAAVGVIIGTLLGMAACPGVLFFVGGVAVTGPTLMGTVGAAAYGVVGGCVASFWARRSDDYRFGISLIEVKDAAKKIEFKQ